jgi:cytochrome c oxidase subunit 2
LQSKQPTRKARVPLRAAVIAGAVALFASGCAVDTVQRGYLPGFSDGEVTNKTAEMTSLWVGTWVAALAVGIITWGLMLWCIVAYRKRKDDNQLPIQTRYHVPLEIMYVIVPLAMILVFFSHTDRVMMDVTKVAGDADVHIQVIGKQWSWDFNYVDSDVWDSGVQLFNVGEQTDMVDGVPGTSQQLPTLYLPVGKKVEFTVDSRDVIHSFWIPAFLFKIDAIPGHQNKFEVIPERLGTYAGKCAELCGEFHSGMLFNVKVVTEAEYNAHMDDLRNGVGTTTGGPQVGQLDLSLNRLQTPEREIEGVE